MLGDLAILHTPQVIVAGGRIAEGTLADGKDEVALRQNHVNFIVHHGNALLRQNTQRGVQTRHAIGNAGVVLDVTIRKQAAGGVCIAGGKGVDESQRLFGLALFLLDRRRLLCAFSGYLGSSVLRAASGEDRAEHGKRQRERKNFFHLNYLLSDWACFRLPLAL